MNRNYVCVFKADPSKRDVLIDIGGDPDFTEPLPTWGICRPDVRSYVKKGSFLFFVGNYIGTNEYYVKGFFQVGEKISHKEALDRFPDRKNVIVSKSNEILLNNNKWEDKDIKNKVKSLYGEIYPEFFTKINCKGCTFVQNINDDHPIDNWKCRRIFCCEKSQIENCINNNFCIKNESFYFVKNYVVSSQLWCNIDNYMIPWDKVCPKSKKDRNLKVKVKGRPRHPPIKLNDEESNEIILNIKNILDLK